MSLAHLSAQQLSDLLAVYQASSSSVDVDERNVAQARVQELLAEQARRATHPDGRQPAARHNHWPNVDLAALIRESGCILVDRGNGKLVGDHSVKHASKSGTCLVVWQAEQRYFCASCKEGGDAAGWVASVKGCDYHAAATELRLRFGVAPTEDTADGEDGDEDAGQEKHPPSQATKLVQLTTGRCELFHDSESVSYATFEAAGHNQTWPLRGRTFKNWLGALYYAAHQRACGSQAIADALIVLEGQARFVGPAREVYTRLAEHDNAIYLDLADEDWQAVEITPGGWRIIDDVPVKFRRPRGLAALPVPTSGGSLTDLRRFVNVGGDGDLVLMVAWLVAALRPRGPYPVLALHGEQGAAKSTTERVLKSLVDPGTTPLRSAPKEPRDLMIAATNAWIVAYDNLSHLQPWLSDAICRLATGGGFSTRELYTDAEEVLFEAQRPVILNGIEELGTRGDLLDRSLILHLPQIPDDLRRPEDAFWTEFRQAHALLLGALLDAVSAALRNLSSVRLARLPRMADFALWATAAESSLGWRRGTFLSAYAGNRAEANDLTLEASPIVPPLRAFLSSAEGKTWTGTTTELLGLLGNLVEERVRREKTWPKTARGLSGALRRLAPNLRTAGVGVDFGRTPDAERRRIVTVSARGSEFCVQPSETVLSGDFASEDGAFASEAPYFASEDGEGAGPSSLGRVATEPRTQTTEPRTQNTDFRTVADGTGRSDAKIPYFRGAGEEADDGAVDSGDDRAGLDDGLGTVAVETAPLPGIRLDEDDPADRGRPGGAGPPAAPQEVRPSATAGGSTSACSECVVLTSVADAEAALPDLLAAPVLGLDCETTGLDPHRDRIRLVQVATPERTYVLDAFQVDLAILRPVFESESVKVLHNAKFDLQFLLAHGLTVGNVYDTMLADQVLRGSRIPRSLTDLSAEYLSIQLDKSDQRSDWTADLSERQLAYAARDAAVLLPLRDRLDAAIQEAGLGRCLALENRAVPAIAWLEFSGAPFDSEAWRKLADGALAEKLRLEDELTEIARAALGNNTLFGREVNWEAPAQVLGVLKSLSLDAANTTEDVLQTLADRHPIVGKLLAYREVAKRCGTYGLNVLGDVHPKTGRIHADWHQVGADSGRMSCTRPNLQNVPRTPVYRACFRAPEGRVLVKADYNQLELRIAAELAGDKRMLGAYGREEDLHVLTAQTVLGKSEVSKEDRQIAKSLNFGLLYGMGAPALASYARASYGVSLTLAEAERFRAAFFETYPGLRAWHRAQCDGTVATRTVCGRIRRGVERFTEKLNTPVQGTGADGLKAALALLWETRDRCPSAFPVLAVHDEIVVECAEGDAWTVQGRLVECMRRAMGAFLRKVPVVVEATVARDWSLAEPIEPLPPGVDWYDGPVPEGR